MPASLALLCRYIFGVVCCATVAFCDHKCDQTVSGLVPLVSESLANRVVCETPCLASVYSSRFKVAGSAHCRQSQQTMPEVHQDEFFWVDSNEPHAQRRKAVLAKYGNQVRKLYGYDNRTAYQVIGCLCWHCGHTHWIIGMSARCG